MFNNDKHTVVTATREPLGELITDDVAQSEFWNLLIPVHVEPFNEVDCGEIFETEGFGEEKPGAIKELINQTGGMPVVLLKVIRVLKRDHIGESITADLVQKAAKSTEEGLSDRIFPAIWNSLSQEVQDAYQILLDDGESPASEIEKTMVRMLRRNGLARLGAGKIKAQALILGKYAQSLTSGKRDLQILFGNEQSYWTNMRSVLNHRLESVDIVENTSYKLLRKAVADLAEDPIDCLSYITRIRDCIINKVISLEFGGCEEFPNEMVQYWTQHKNPGKPLAELFTTPDLNIPTDTGLLLQVIQLLTGCKPKYESRSTYCSKDTYVLLRSISEFRNRVEHPGGETMSHGTAVVALLACVELMASLARDIDK
jgi:hypothetical protein